MSIHICMSVHICVHTCIVTYMVLMLQLDLQSLRTSFVDLKTHFFGTSS